MKIAFPLALICTLALLAAPASAQQKKQSKKGDQRTATSLNIGATAPDFKLKTMDGNSEVQLSSFRGKRPVVLVFGSYT